MPDLSAAIKIIVSGARGAGGAAATGSGIYPFVSPVAYGMQVNNAAAENANLAAWNECRAANKLIIMPLGTIWMPTTFKIDTPYSTVLFSSRSTGYGDGTGTRVISSDTTKPAMLIGSELAPVGGPNNFPRNITVINPCAGFSVAHGSAIGVAIDDLAVAIKMAYLLEGYVEYPWAHEAPVGFKFHGLVGTDIKRPKAFRSRTLSATGKFYGAYFKGVPPVLAGGNASLHIDSLVVQSPSGVAFNDECAVVCDGAISDVRIDRLETSAIKNVIRINGTGANGEPGSNINFEIKELIGDSFSGIGVDIQNIAQNGHIKIAGNCMSAAGAQHGIFIKDNFGLIDLDLTIHGYGAAALNNLGQTTGTMTGLRVENTYGLAGNVNLIDCPNPVELDVFHNADLRITVRNPNVVSNPYQAAIFYTQGHNSSIKARVTGINNAFPQGIYGPANDCSDLTFSGLESIASNCISGGNTSKIQINGTPIAQQGIYTSAGVINPEGTITLIGNIG